TRRIEAVTGKEALKKVQEYEKILSQSAHLLQTTVHQIPHKIKQVQEELESVRDKILQYHKQENNQIALTLLERATSIPGAGSGIKLIAEVLENKTIDDLRIISDYLRNSGESVITLLGTAEDNKVNLILMMTPKLCKEDFNAITIIKEIAPIIEGSGGGRKDLAQAGGKRVDKLNEALNHFSHLIKSKLK
ncbi:MAG: DHHA1 domain-containing protein, partial [Planctomycetota bacterium]